MNSASSSLYTFGPYRLDPLERLLLRDGQPVPLSPKAFEMLLVLVRHSGRVVDKELLLKEVWPDTFVEEGNLTVHMSALRKALGDDGETSAFIETVPRRGYRFLLPVEQASPEAAPLLVERRVETRIVREEIEENVGLSARAWPYLALAAAVLLVVAAVTWRVAMKAGAPPPALRITTFASFPTGVSVPTFAPDGERIAFAWTGPADKNWNIYVKTIGNDPPLQLTSGPANDLYPTWSPDGRRIAFLRESSNPGAAAIYVIGSLGGPERKILDLPFNRYFDLEWSPDGRTIAFAKKTNLKEPWDNFRSLAISLLDVETLQTRQLTFPESNAGDDRFAFSSDGSLLAFVRRSESGGGTAMSIWVVPAGGGPAAKIFEQIGWIGHLTWTPDADSIIFSSPRDGGNKLFRIARRGGEPQPVPLSEDQAYYPAFTRRGHRMLYVREYSDSDLMRVDLSSESTAVKSPAPLIASSRAELAPAISPDGSQLAFFSEGTGRGELWLSSSDGSNPVALTDSHATSSDPPGWSSDGRQIVFSSEYGPAGSEGGVFLIQVATREVRRLLAGAYMSPSWSRDGKWIYVTYTPQRGRPEIWKVASAGGTPTQVTSRGGTFAQESFDGHTLYYTKPSGSIWAMPVAGGAETELIAGFPAAFRGYWRVAKGGIYLLKADELRDDAIEFFDFSTRRSRAIAPIRGALWHQSGLSVSSDGRVLIYAASSTRPTSDIMLVENFR